MSLEDDLESLETERKDYVKQVLGSDRNYLTKGLLLLGSTLKYAYMKAEIEHEIEEGKKPFHVKRYEWTRTGCLATVVTTALLGGLLLYGTSGSSPEGENPDEDTKFLFCPQEHRDIELPNRTLWDFPGDALVYDPSSDTYMIYKRTSTGWTTHKVLADNDYLVEFSREYRIFEACKSE